MTASLSLGNKSPEYMQKSVWGVTVSSFLTQAGALLGGHRPGEGGNYAQNGGEWVFVGGELRWCHRMRNTRDHTEVDELRRVLEGLEREGKEVTE